MQVCTYASMHIYASVQVAHICKYASMQVYASRQVCKYASTQAVRQENEL